jgi:hypothetical protein
MVGTAALDCPIALRGNSLDTQYIVLHERRGTGPWRELTSILIAPDRRTEMRSRPSEIIFVALTIFFAGTTRADEAKVAISEVPKAGLDAVKAMFVEAEITGAAKETEDGKTFYEVSLKQKGRHIDVIVGEDGKIQVVEKEIAAGDLPEAVRRALDTKYPKASRKLIEEVSNVKDGKPILDFFEVVLVTAKKQTLEVQITPNGHIKNEETKKSEKD